VRPLCDAPYGRWFLIPPDLDQSTPDRKAFMKFVSLRTKRAQRQGKPDKPFRATHESFAEPAAEPHQIHTYAELRQQIHDDLRIQHPEWVEPNGKSPMCDSYEARLMELLDGLGPRFQLRRHASSEGYRSFFSVATKFRSQIGDARMKN
jgi:hypothetical protein